LTPLEEIWIPLAETKTMTNASSLAWLLVIGCPISGCFTAGMGFPPFSVPFALFVFGVVSFKLSKRVRARKRFEYLRSKYRDDAVFHSILERHYWISQTADQLEDSLGKPHGIDHKALKTIGREVWKYDHRGSNRYRLRITLDNGNVAAWDDKQWR
jgi:hypothetical protein